MAIHPIMAQALAPFMPQRPTPAPAKTMKQLLIEGGRAARAAEIEPRPLTLKEMTAHMRGRIANAGIKARVRMCGDAIQVFVPQHGLSFTEEEQRAIRTLAKINGLTKVRGSEIDPERMTDPHHFDFFLPVER